MSDSQRRSTGAPLVLLALTAAAARTEAQSPEPAWDIGYRLGTCLGSGEPANDLPIAANVFVRRQLDARWSATAWIESASGDLEEPSKIVGLQQDQDEAAIDADLSVLSFGLGVERRIWSSGSSRLYGLLGAAYSSPEADDADGPLEGGGTFDVHTDPGSEILASLGLGYQWRAWEHWSLEALVRYDHHFAGWELEDRISGATGEIDDYGSTAILVGFSYSP